MKKINSALIVTGMLFGISCKKDFYEIPPAAQISGSQVGTIQGITNLLTGAYAALEAHGTNWKIDCASDDAYFGGDFALTFEKHNVLPTNGNIEDKWSNLYNGVSRANEVLRTIATSKGLDDAAVKNLRAQAKFLRAFYYFELRIIFKNVPYVDENAKNTYLPNTTEIWPKIEGDLNDAITDLPPTQSDKGRANSWAAKALLAKTYMFENKLTEAKALLQDIISNGTTSDGQKYDLDANFRDAFDVKTKNSKESVFAVQHAYSVASNGANAANGELANHPVIAGVLAGFVNYKPTINLGDAFKTDGSGLPLFNNFADVDLKNDQQVDQNAPFLNDSLISLDPRLDWTIGRRGIPYLDYGLAPGVSAWAGGYNNLFGPYWPVKNVLFKADLAAYANPNFSIQDAHNYNVIRFADVLLWAAECEVEKGSLAQAMIYVNQVRARAKASSYVKEIDANGNPIPSQNAANYQIGLYTSFPDQAYARNAVRFERRLELAMEGHRFYDLVRWGIADVVINAYLAAESRPADVPGLAGGKFVKGKDEYFPIPQAEITNSYVDGKPTLIQNNGY